MNRNTILDDFVTCLSSISIASGYEQDIDQTVRAFLPYEKIFTFPVLMVLGGGEEFTPLIDGDIQSLFSIIIRGYTKNVDTPEKTSCDLIKDVLKVLESTENTHKEIMQIISIATDEGFFGLEFEGAAMFEILVQMQYQFPHENP